MLCLWCSSSWEIDKGNDPTHQGWDWNYWMWMETGSIQMQLYTSERRMVFSLLVLFSYGILRADLIIDQVLQQDYVSKRACVNWNQNYCSLLWYCLLQWSVNCIKACLNCLHGSMFLNKSMKSNISIHKLYQLPAQWKCCRMDFSFHTWQKVGPYDGEAPEHGWAEVNPLEPAQGRRNGFLDQAGTWGCTLQLYNWKKCTVWAVLSLCYLVKMLIFQ